jgi:hypothetical protein
MTSKVSRLALGTATGLACLFISDNGSSIKRYTLVAQAEARIGNPLSPGSIAGVNRRVERRAYRRGYYGGGYYRPGLGLAAGAALGTTAAYYGNGYYAGGGYYGNSGYASAAYGNSGYGNAAYDTSGGDTYILHGNYISEADAVAYCAQRFRSYDVASRTFLAYGGQRVSCPAQ